MHKVMILGSEGFLGTHISDYLIEMGDVLLTTFDLGESEHKPHIRDSICNIGEYADVVQEQDAIIDLIGLSGASSDFSNSKKLFDANLQSLIDVLEVCKGSSRTPFFIFPSSRLVYAGRDSTEPIVESDPVDPLSLYGVTKLTGEQIIKSYCRINGNVRYLIFRISIPYGLGYNEFSRHGIVNMFIHHALNDLDIPIFGDGSQVRDIINVRDVARIMYAAIGRSGSFYNRVLNIGGDEHFSLNEIAEKAISLTGAKSKIVCKPWPEAQRLVETGNMVLSNREVKAAYAISELGTLDASIRSYLRGNAKICQA